jgi:uncharacterized protein
MPELAADLPTLIPFLLLLMAVIGLWIDRKLWITALAASIAAAYYTGALQGLAALWIALLTALALAYRWARSRPPSAQTTLLRLVFGVLFFVLALAMALLLLPGFPRTTLVASTALTPGAAPYGIGLGFAKVVTGILILGLINTDRVRSLRELGTALGRVIPIFLVTVALVMMFTLALGYVRFEPKWTSLFLIWAVVNLFFTCLSEEAFFRGFVQHELARIGSNAKLAAAVAIVVSAVLFGLAHFGGGWTYVAAGIIAGLGYAIAYQRTQRIEAAMAVHFTLNATHFLLFTYPSML